MKKIILAIIIIFLQIISLSSVFANDTTTTWLVDRFNKSNQNTDEKNNDQWKLLLVSEKPLGARKCECAGVHTWTTSEGQGKYFAINSGTNGDCPSTVDISKRLYVCEKATLSEMIQGIVAYIIQIALLLGVLAVAALGVAWGVAGGDDPVYKSDLKKWLVGLIVGLILIYGFQYILGLFGWIYTANV